MPFSTGCSSVHLPCSNEFNRSRLSAAGQSGELPQKVLGDASPISELQSKATYREQEAGGKRQPAPDYSCSRKGGPDGDSRDAGEPGRYNVATAEGKCHQRRLQAEV